MGTTMTAAPDPLGPPPAAGSILGSGAPIAEREGRLLEGADGLAAARPSILSHPQLLIAAAAALMTAGVSAVLLGWVGASHTTRIEEQVPYLISGGLLGVALATIGALLFFSHWLTVSIKEARGHEASRRADHEELLEARRADHQELIEALEALGTTQAIGGIDGDARGDQPQRPLRRAPRRS